MLGQTNLQVTLNSLQVTCDDVRYDFATIVESSAVSIEDVLGVFQEKEGLTIIASKDYLEANSLAFEGPFAQLTIAAHTSLDLLGLTAVLATKLAQTGISANVIAGYFHDHIFVQYDLRQQAIKSLDELKMHK